MSKSIPRYRFLFEVIFRGKDRAKFFVTCPNFKLKVFLGQKLFHFKFPTSGCIFVIFSGFVQT